MCFLVLCSTICVCQSLWMTVSWKKIYLYPSWGMTGCEHEAWILSLALWKMNEGVAACSRDSNSSPLAETSLFFRFRPIIFDNLLRTANVPVSWTLKTRLGRNLNFKCESSRREEHFENVCPSNDPVVAGEFCSGAPDADLGTRVPVFVSNITSDGMQKCHKALRFRKPNVMVSDQTFFPLTCSASQVRFILA